MSRITLPGTRTLAVLAVVGCVLLAGCSGWGGDGPTDDGSEDNESDDLEEADDEANDTQSDSPDAEDGSGNESNGTTDEDMNGTDESSPDSEDEGDTTETEQNDSADDTGDEPTEEYANPGDIRVDGVTHMESEASLDHDAVTLHNTNEELVLPIGGWEIEMDGQDQRVTIDEGTVIEPGENHTIQFADGEKVLNEAGGVIHLYDTDGNHVGSWDHIGSPSSPPESSEDNETGYVQFEIVDAATGEGIDEAGVTLDSVNESENEQLTGSTDDAGVTTIREIPYGEYELTVTHDEYADHSETITVDEESAKMTIELESSEGNAAKTLTVETIGTAGV